MINLLKQINMSIKPFLRSYNTITPFLLVVDVDQLNDF